tara:strand:+ start:1244 stop:2470 length:1227 start_codon:yes stop_codon:yes gene_type:complete
MALFFYNVIIALLSPFILIYSVVKSFGQKDKNILLERLGFTSNSLNNKTCIHCASLGEVNGAKKLIHSMKEEYDICISVNTKSGKDRAKSLFPDLKVFYLPLDYKIIIRNWLNKNIIKSLLIFETEIWPNLLNECKKRDIRTAIINARISKKNLEKKFLISIYKKSLKACSYVLCKSDYELRKYKNLGLSDNIKCIGNLKYESTDRLDNNNTPNIENYILLASTHSPEEINLLGIISSSLENNINVVIAPRHVSRSKNINKLMIKNKINSMLYSDLDFKSLNKPTVIIIDTFGELVKFYKKAVFVFVGGSFSSRGVQNIIEPAYYSRPIIVGPNVDNFYDEVSELSKNKGLIKFSKIEDINLFFEKFINKDINLDQIGRNAGKLIAEKSGITNLYIDFLYKEGILTKN